MTRWPLRHAGKGAAPGLPVAWLCLAVGAAVGGLLAPVHASTVRVHYDKDRDAMRAAEATEAEIKAAFLLRFPDFVHWQTALGDTLRIGVMGDAELQDALVRLGDEQNRAAGSGTPRQVSVFRVSSPGAARRCHILILGDTSTPEIAAILSAAHQAGALTVGDWNEPRDGTVIRLFRDGRRVRFDISQALAKEAGLRISSKLLNLARGQTSRIAPPGGVLALG